MKIGILTLPLHTNFGGILQAYALQTILERYGHDVNVLQRTKITHSPLIMPIVYMRRIIRNLCTSKKTPIFIERKSRLEAPIIRQKTNQFLNKYINLYEINDLSDIRQNDFDAIIVGSDQIWRRRGFIGMWSSDISNAFLAFTKKWDIKRIAYAASFGVDHWDYLYFETMRCAKAVKTFEAISVREDSGVDLCRDHLGVDASHVLDPTFLLSKDDYMKLVTEANTPQSSGDMLCYILDSTEFKTNIINQISAENNLTPFNVNTQVENHSIPVEQRIQPSVETWLRGFYDAKFVVTDSFHACVFSIIFRKPFIVIGNASRGMTRFTSLLRLFGLESRLITETKQELPNNYFEQLKIEKILGTHIQASLKYLNTYLG